MGRSDVETCLGVAASLTPLRYLGKVNGGEKPDYSDGKLRFNFIALASKPLRCPIPIFAVEISDFWIKPRGIVETCEMHAPAIRVRFRLVEAFDAADSAKQVFCLAAAEAVRRQHVCATQELEAIMGNEKVQKA